MSCKSSVAWLVAVGVCLPSCGGDNPRPADPRRDVEGGRDAANDVEGARDVAPSDAEDDVADGSDATNDDSAVDDADVPMARPQVLFVGNSYTAYNELPAVVAALVAQTDGVGIDIEVLTRGGARLGDHYMSTGALERIESGEHDIVVVQGQSLEPITRGAEFDYYGVLLSTAIHEAGARPIWFATWPREEGNEFYPSWGVATPDDAAARIEGRYQWVAGENDDFVARVGAAWQLAVAELPDIGLYAADGSHPSPAGSMLAACVLALALTGEEPQVPDPVPLGLSREDAEQLCALAPRTACWFNWLLCDGACRNPQNDFDHCGGCAKPCPPDLPCIDGECQCTFDRTGCSRYCADLQTNLQHCGECDNPCTGSGEVCDEGRCVCPPLAQQNVSNTELTDRDPECTDPIQGDPEACAAVGHDICASQDCFGTGIGPAFSPGFGQAVMCLPTEPTVTSYTELSEFDAGCDGTGQRYGLACAGAVHQFCVSQGASAGYGPVASDGDSADVVCLEGAVVVETDYVSLSSVPGGWMCDGDEAPDDRTCTLATWFYCVFEEEALGGFGPIEVVGDVVFVVCLVP